jgi:SAM-dependent methyltransferase
VDLNEYRASADEKERTADLLKLLPKNRNSVLDIGARDGHFSRLLTEYFSEVTALDIEKPSFEIEGVKTVAGDATRLHFPSESFDVVFCAEVLEHIRDFRGAAREIARVARHEVVIGVPFEQDTRLGRTVCGTCGRLNPPWGHINSFTEAQLRDLFAGLRCLKCSLVGSTCEETNALSAWLMGLGGHPWGTYEQEEPCIHCGKKLVAPSSRSLTRRLCSKTAERINRIQSVWARSRPKWIHMLFSKHAALGSGACP